MTDKSSGCSEAMDGLCTHELFSEDQKTTVIKVLYACQRDQDRRLLFGQANHDRMPEARSLNGNIEIKDGLEEDGISGANHTT